MVSGKEPRFDACRFGTFETPLTVYVERCAARLYPLLLKENAVSILQHRKLLVAIISETVPFIPEEVLSDVILYVPGILTALLDSDDASRKPQLQNTMFWFRNSTLQIFSTYYDIFASGEIMHFIDLACKQIWSKH